MFLDKGLTPENIQRLEAVSDLAHRDWLDLRSLLAARFARGRETNAIGSHNSAYARVRGLMASEKLFDISQEPQAMRDKYGPTVFVEGIARARELRERRRPDGAARGDRRLG
jgi:hypothetical protein